jgi:hypothetical protein
MALVPAWKSAESRLGFLSSGEVSLLPLVEPCRLCAVLKTSHALAQPTRGRGRSFGGCRPPRRCRSPSTSLSRPSSVAGARLAQFRPAAWLC